MHQIRARHEVDKWGLLGYDVLSLREAGDDHSKGPHVALCKRKGVFGLDFLHRAGEVMGYLGRMEWQDHHDPGVDGIHATERRTCSIGGLDASHTPPSPEIARLHTGEINFWTTARR